MQDILMSYKYLYPGWCGLITDTYQFPIKVLKINRGDSPSLVNHKYSIVICNYFSGSKSQQKTSSPAVMKEDKLLNPASRRVKDAAENLLSLVMEQVFIMNV